jgi:hypothetical protein
VNKQTNADKQSGLASMTVYLNAWRNVKSAKNHHPLKKWSALSIVMEVALYIVGALNFV